MFDDPRKELRRLERQLLDEEDDWLDDALEEAHRLIGDDEPEDEPLPPPVRGAVRSRNTDSRDVDLEEYSDLVHNPPKKKGIRIPALVLCLELLGIAAVAAYWLLFLL